MKKDTQKKKKVKVEIDTQRCKGCYLCVVNCPNGLIKVAGELNVRGIKPVYFNDGNCTGCAMCAVVCPETIIKISR